MHKVTIEWTLSVIYFYMYVCVLCRSVVSDSLQLPGLQSARLLCSWDFSGKNTGVGCHFLLHGIFPTQVEWDKYCEDYFLVKKDIHTL